MFNLVQFSFIYIPLFTKGPHVNLLSSSVVNTLVVKCLSLKLSVFKCVHCQASEKTCVHTYKPLGGSKWVKEILHLCLPPVALKLEKELCTAFHFCVI